MLDNSISVYVAPACGGGGGGGGCGGDGCGGIKAGWGVGCTVTVGGTTATGLCASTSPTVILPRGPDPLTC